MLRYPDQGSVGKWKSPSSSSQSLFSFSPLLGAVLLEHKQQSQAPSSLLSTSSWANSRLKAENSTLRFVFVVSNVLNMSEQEKIVTKSRLKAENLTL